MLEDVNFILSKSADEQMAFQLNNKYNIIFKFKINNKYIVDYIILPT